MRKIYSILAAVLITASALAQAPNKMSYQAVIRNSSDQLVANTKVGMRISVLQGATDGAAVYTEIQTPTTNANGLVSIQIGGGDGFDAIAWGSGSFFVKTETDPTGGTDYSIVGASQLLSVPYALYAETTGSSIGGLKSGSRLKSGTGTVLIDDGVGLGVGANPLANTQLYLQRPSTSVGAGFSNIYAYRAGNNGASNGGLNWSRSGVDAAIKGYSYWGNSYSSALAGYSDLDHINSAAVIGGYTQGTIWGALGYKDATNAMWAGYFTGNMNITGTLRLQGGTPGLGKVLVSDANGNATWQNSAGTNIAQGTRTATTVPVTSSTGTAATLTIATTTLAGVMSGADKAKLDKYPAGTAPGQMLYWDGTKWITVPTGSHGQNLTNCYGVPTWGSCIERVTSATGRIWMDRNLGASQVATSAYDEAAYGDLYQWGRGTDGHEKRTSGTTSVKSNTDNPGHSNFILPNSSPYNWRTEKNDNLWQGATGTNNPCPTGYRLPTQAEWTEEFQSWSTQDRDGAFNSPLKLPLGGQRDNQFGSIGLGTGFYWSSTVYNLGNSVHAFRLIFSWDVSATMVADYYSKGLSVRCIKD